MNIVGGYFLDQTRVCLVQNPGATLNDVKAWFFAKCADLQTDSNFLTLIPTIYGALVVQIALDNP